MKKPVYQNKYDRNTLETRLEQEGFKRITVSMYRYAHLKNPQIVRDSLFLMWNNLEILGRIYVAKEGINAQFSCPEPNWEKFINSLNDFEFLKDIPLKIAIEDEGNSFIKLTIKVRSKILADGMDDDSYDVTNVGKHLTAQKWNEYMNHPDTIIVDVRNHYESEIGHFKGAILPQSDIFKDELPMIKEELKGKEDKKILLYCTGGIRCEKTSAFLKHNGFNDVNQLHGGIIDYVQQIKVNNLENKFIGKNFVFDNRLGETITNDIVSNCHQCGEPCNNHTNCNYKDCNMLFIQCNKCKNEFESCCSNECLETAKLPIEAQKEIRKKRDLERLINVPKFATRLTFKIPPLTNVPARN